MIHKSEIFGFETVVHDVDVCVIGGGAAGLFAAVAAARNGARVALMHDRPVLGGNASSEIRMWIRGARGRDKNESGLVEELALMNLSRNPTLNFSIWDSVSYELAFQEKNLELILNCSCLDAVMKDGEIQSVKGWQTTTQTYHTVRAQIFADCSGDSVLAPLSGAEFRMGREAQAEFQEDIAPIVSDNCTMGMSCLFQVRETDRDVPYKAPYWARKFTDETIAHRVNPGKPTEFQEDNFWWIEIGGMGNSIADTEKNRHELLAISFGVWDYYKNSGHFDSAKWELEWVGFLPGKRESRRYVGDYILTQNDVRSGGHFDDLIAYGGWTMDDHDPAGFATAGSPNHFHPAPSPFGIPYRCLYSKNIPNLMFAGRNISCTHTAMSSCRVMGTCATLGQALGTAAAMAVRLGTTPRGIYDGHIAELQQTLMENDCYLPFYRRALSPALADAKATVGTRDASVVLDGIDRVIDGVDHKLTMEFGESLILDLGEAKEISGISLILDSDLNRDTLGNVNRAFKDYPLRCNRWLHEEYVHLPATLLRDFDVAIDDGSGIFTTLSRVRDNSLRLWKTEVHQTARRICIIPHASYGSEKAYLYSVILR